MSGSTAIVNTFESAPFDPTGFSSLNTEQLAALNAVSYNDLAIVASGEPRKGALIPSFLRPQRQTSSLCRSCRAIDFGVLLDGPIRIFSKKMVRIRREAESCTFCSLLLKSLSLLYPDLNRVSKGYCVITAAPSVGGGSLKKSWLWLRWQSQKLKKNETVARDRPWVSLDAPDDDVPTVASAIALQLFGPPKSKDHCETSNLLLGRQVQPCADVALLRSWLNICQTSHEQQCEPMRFPGNYFGMRVIDVQRRCVVFAPENCRYVALSYVWGEARQLLLIDETLSQLVDLDGALADNNVSVPMTIRDAMLLCEMLGEKYLWVDALCIQQDSGDDKARQLNAMGSIYQCAAFTIVAACGDGANCGLSGIRPGSRVVQQHVSQIDSFALGCTLPLFVDSVLDSAWHSRGWTCQEKHLSSRLLIFTAGQVFWRCRTSTFCEDVYLETSSESSTISRRLETSRIRNFMISQDSDPHSRLSQLLVDYTTRQLRYDSDALDAVSGILSKFAPTFTFFWGLPIENMVESLYWHSPSVSVVERRPNFPSWSWVGWKTPIHGNFLPGGGHPIKDRYPPVYPITKVFRLGSRGQCLPLDDDDAVEMIKEVDRLDGHSFVYEPFRDWQWNGGDFPDDPYDKPYAWYANNQWPLEPPPLTPEEWLQLRPIRKKILRFHTWTFKIRVGVDQMRGIERTERTQRYWLHGTSASIWLDRQWREAQQEKLMFMALAQRRFPNWGATTIDFFLICFEEKDGVAYRVQRVDNQIDSDGILFSKCEPEWRVINLA
ncbi:uncharacterized protein PV09_04779 [Verruconis gallopava]|uniref:Heterokaryon incompatibility domain-containing protein n=1 Tax=Verruconis gallopava TaxID=253628 RepID=A0A0D1YTG7_9PEZI|nr:uncharacterized protein PV09_04779 [Verruconis gallopava]KIW03942.1 hypothetical protein PV09_04779 [Verruconis gallopava]